MEAVIQGGQWEQGLTTPSYADTLPRSACLCHWLWPGALIHMTYPLSYLTKVPTHMWWWGHLRTPKRFLSFFNRHWGTLCSAGYTDTCGHQSNPRPTQPISFQKTQLPAKNKRATPRNLWTQMVVFLELGIQNRKEERPGLQPDATGIAALPGDSCFQKGRKPWVAGVLPERALA